MARRIKIPARTKWESSLGYSRAVRAGNIIKVSATAAADENSKIVGVNNAYEQTMYIIDKISNALKEAGSKLEDIVSNKIYLADISNFDLAAKAYSEFFKDIKPALTVVEVKGFIDPQILLEIESDAVID